MKCGAISRKDCVKLKDHVLTVAIPDYRPTPGNKGSYALRRI